MSRIKSLTFDGPAGRLEGILKFHDTQAPKALAVVCHPHPLFHGTMHNKVVFAIAEAFFSLRCEVLRFNFRGVGISAGTHDQGRGELEDTLAAVKYLRERHPGLPCHIAGFSFGAWIAVEAFRSDFDLASLTAVAPPFKYFDPKILQTLKRPKLFLQGTADDLCPVEELQAWFPWFAEPKAQVLFEGAGHFFNNHLADLRKTIAEHQLLLGL
jgi:alpha/beta superfamily hydrolase